MDPNVKLVIATLLLLTMRNFELTKQFNSRRSNFYAFGVFQQSFTLDTSIDDMDIGYLDGMHCVQSIRSAEGERTTVQLRRLPKWKVCWSKPQQSLDRGKGKQGKVKKSDFLTNKTLAIQGHLTLQFEQQCLVDSGERASLPQKTSPKHVPA